MGRRGRAARHQAQTSSTSRSAVAAGALLAALTIIAYLPALRAGFVWDDDDYVTAQPRAALARTASPPSGSSRARCRSTTR